MVDKASTEKQRVIGLDIYRILAVFFIYLFHSNVHIQCDYWILTPFINMGAVYMTAFFLLSGFSLFLTWSKKDLHRIDVIKTFYSKRLVGILPLYYSAALLFIIFIGQETLLQNVVLAPVELLGIQSTFTGLFSVSHNGGTWFVSCILLCYFLYPFIQEIIKQIGTKNKVIWIILSAFMLLYSPFVVGYFNTSATYPSPFYRMLEFMIGALLCSMMSDIKRCNIEWLFSWWAFIIEYIVLITGVTAAVYLNISVGNYMLYSWIALPCFTLQLNTLSGMSFSIRLQKSFLLRYLCDISYAFFFAQLFTWKVSMYLIKLLGNDTNYIRIMVSFTISIFIAIFLHEVIEKRIVAAVRKSLGILKSL